MWEERQRKDAARDKNWERLKNGGEEEEKDVQDLQCVAAINCKNTSPLSLALSPHSFSYTLLHPVLGYGPWPASVFYLYPVAQHSGGVHDFVSRKTGCVYREMRKTLLGELNHRNSYLPRPLPTTAQNCVHPPTHTWSANPQNTQRLLPKFQRTQVHVHTLGAFA